MLDCNKAVRLLSRMAGVNTEVRSKHALIASWRCQGPKDHGKLMMRLSEVCLCEEDIEQIHAHKLDTKRLGGAEARIIIMKEFASRRKGETNSQRGQWLNLNVVQCHKQISRCKERRYFRI